MGMVKKIIETPKVEEVKKPESGVDAAVARLQAPKTEIKYGEAEKKEAVRSITKGRDFDKEARGKTLCVLLCAAFQSPFMAGLPIKTRKEFVEECIKSAEEGTEWIFGK
jgi:hypothetical protein